MIRPLAKLLLSRAIEAVKGRARSLTRTTVPVEVPAALHRALSARAATEGKTVEELMLSHCWIVETLHTCHEHSGPVDILLAKIGGHEGQRVPWPEFLGFLSRK